MSEESSPQSIESESPIVSEQVSLLESSQNSLNEKKRGRGRPPILKGEKDMEENAKKLFPSTRKRGRPVGSVKVKDGIKRGRGRPKKNQIPEPILHSFPKIISFPENPKFPTDLEIANQIKDLIKQERNLESDEELRSKLEEFFGVDLFYRHWYIAEVHDVLNI